MKMESLSNRCRMSPEDARDVILTWDSTESSNEGRGKMIFQGEREDIEMYLLAVDVIRRSSDEDRGRRNSVIQIAMARLENEFRNLLVTQASESDSLESVTSRLSISGDGQDHDGGEGEGSVHMQLPIGLEDYSESIVSRRSSSGFSLRELDLVSCEAVDDLRSIAERMAACGFSAACVRAHSGARRSAMETTLRKLGIEKLTIGDVQKMEGRSLEKRIRRWIRAARVCFRVVFPAEKRLSDQIFAGITNMDETSFSDTVKPSALQLLTFAESIGIVSHKSPELLFKVVDLHDCLADLIPDIELAFECKPVQIIPAKAAEILVRLGETIRTILLEFETAVLNEPSLIPVPGGTIHPLTRYVMNYLSLISDYKETLDGLIVLRPVIEPSDPAHPSPPELDLWEFEGKSPLELHLIWIIVVLRHNLETKSKHYGDPSLGHLFIMNNIHYIVQKATSTPELALMIGDGYLRRLTAKYRRAATQYHRSTWSSVLYCLRDEGLHSSGSFSYSGVLKKVLRERFKAFNTMVDEVHRVQTTWHVVDPQLKEELRILILEHLVPAYRPFLGRYRGHIESGRHPEAYIKYLVEDLEGLVSDLFEGTPSSYHARRKLG